MSSNVEWAVLIIYPERDEGYNRCSVCVEGSVGINVKWGSRCSKGAIKWPFGEAVYSDPPLFALWEHVPAPWGSAIPVREHGRGLQGDCHS